VINYLTRMWTGLLSTCTHVALDGLQLELLNARTVISLHSVFSDSVPVRTRNAVIRNSQYTDTVYSPNSEFGNKV